MIVLFPFSPSAKFFSPDKPPSPQPPATGCLLSTEVPSPFCVQHFWLAPYFRPLPFILRVSPKHALYPISFFPSPSVFYIFQPILCSPSLTSDSPSRAAPNSGARPPVSAAFLRMLAFWSCTFSTCWLFLSDLLLRLLVFPPLSIA